MIEGISHITMMVRELEAAGRFLQIALGAEEIYAGGGRQFSVAKEKYFLIGGIWICLMEGEGPAERTYQHIAFTVPDGELDACAARIRAAGAEILPGRPRVEGEGRSLYFYDFDNHLFELHAGTLEERLKRYAT